MGTVRRVTPDPEDLADDDQAVPDGLALAVQAASTAYTEAEVAAELEAEEEAERLARRARMAAEVSGRVLTYDGELSAVQTKAAMWIGHGFTYQEAAEELGVEADELLDLAQCNRTFIRAVNHYRAIWIQLEVLPRSLKLLANLVARDPALLTIKDQLAIIGHVTKLTSEAEERQFKAMKVAVELEQKAEDARERLRLLRERNELVQKRDDTEQERVSRARVLLTPDGERDVVDVRIDSVDGEDEY